MSTISCWRSFRPLHVINDNSYCRALLRMTASSLRNHMLGDDFMFELNDKEVENLSRCKNYTLNMGRGSNIKYKPYVFTEQGVYMLMTVLRGELAIKQSRALVKTFKKMKDYILENRDLIGQREILQLSMETANNRIEINKINSDMISLEKQISDVAEGLKDVVTKSELADMMNSFGFTTVESVAELLKKKTRCYRYSLR